MKVWGIPYVFGGFDIKKIRMAKDSSGNLIIDEGYYSVGAALIVFGGDKKLKSRNTFKRLE